MNKKYYENIINELERFFSKYDNIAFVLIFGTFSQRRLNELSDLDIAIYFRVPLDLVKLGEMISKLEKISQRRVDVVELQDLYKKDAFFAYNIVTNSEVVLMNDFSLYVEFKKNTFLYYFDIMPMKKKFDKAFSERIEQGKFGKRNYA